MPEGKSTFTLQVYISCSLLAVAAMALVAARLPLFQKDIRRPICAGVGVLSLFTLLLSLHLLSAGFEVRGAALSAADLEFVAKGNGLILAAIVLLLISGLGFFFALGAFIWSLVPTAKPRARPEASKTFNPFAGLDTRGQTLNRAQDR